MRNFGWPGFVGRVHSQLTLLGRSEASALVEFAVSLPLLVVLVVGIFDFGGAFNLKQELNNAVREGARFGASMPTNDLLNGATPPSVNAIRYFVDSYLQAARINDCGLNSNGLTAASGTLWWQYQTTGNCPGKLTLTIVRGLASTSPCNLTFTNYGGPTAYTPCTQVSISYPYQWRFNSVIQLLTPGANFGLTQVKTDSTATNTD